jgi:hypothetical protein
MMELEGIRRIMPKIREGRIERKNEKQFVQNQKDHYFLLTNG